MTKKKIGGKIYQPPLPWLEELQSQILYCPNLAGWITGISSRESYECMQFSLVVFPGNTSWRVWHETEKGMKPVSTDYQYGQLGFKPAGDLGKLWRTRLKSSLYKVREARLFLHPCLLDMGCGLVLANKDCLARPSTESTKAYPERILCWEMEVWSQAVEEWWMPKGPNSIHYRASQTQSAPSGWWKLWSTKKRASGIKERTVKRDKSSRREEICSQKESAKQKAVGPSQEGIMYRYNARERKES